MNVAFRVISVNEQPDHSTIARFLVRHRDAIEGLFFEVLALCRQAGMDDLRRLRRKGLIRRVPRSQR